MKKMLCILTALLMAGLMCVSAAAESFPQPEGGKKFETNWAIFNMTVNIFYEEEGYRVYIQSSDPMEHKGTEWEYACFYNEEKDALLSFTSSKNSYTLDTATGEIERGDYEYEDIDDYLGVVYLSLDNGVGKAIVKEKNYHAVEFFYENGEISKLTCDCYSAGMCEHEIAVLFELRHKLKWIDENYADKFQRSSYFAELDKAAFCNMVLMSRQNGSFQIG